MRSRKLRRSGEVLFGSAGWLFADLMLALVMMLFLATAISASNATPKPELPIPTPPTTTTTTPPKTTAPPQPPRLLPVPLHIDVTGDVEGLRRNEHGAVVDFRQKVRKKLAKPLAGKRAAIVLTFGPGPSGGISRGVDLARKFNGRVLRALGGKFTNAAFRDYFQNDKKPNTITFDIFVFDS